MVLWMSTEFERTNIFLPFKWWAALSPECCASCRSVLESQGYHVGHFRDQQNTVAFMQYSAGPSMLQPSSLPTGTSSAASEAGQRGSAVSSPGGCTGIGTGNVQVQHSRAVDFQLGTPCAPAEPATITAQPYSSEWSLNSFGACSMLRAVIEHDFQVQSGIESCTPATFTGVLTMEARRPGKDGYLWLIEIRGDIACQDPHVQQCISLDEVSVSGRFFPTPQGKRSWARAKDSHPSVKIMTAAGLAVTCASCRFFCTRCVQQHLDLRLILMGTKGVVKSRIDCIHQVGHIGLKADDSAFAMASGITSAALL